MSTENAQRESDLQQDLSSEVLPLAGTIMPCGDCHSLLEGYKEAVTEYTDAVVEMRRHAVDGSYAEFERICALTEQAREKCKAARLSLDRHVAENHWQCQQRETIIRDWS